MTADPRADSRADQMAYSSGDMKADLLVGLTGESTVARKVESMVLTTVELLAEMTAHCLVVQMESPLVVC